MKSAARLCLFADSSPLPPWLAAQQQWGLFLSPSLLRRRSFLPVRLRALSPVVAVPRNHHGSAGGNRHPRRCSASLERPSPPRARARSLANLRAGGRHTSVRTAGPCLGSCQQAGRRSYWPVRFVGERGVEQEPPVVQSWEEADHRRAAAAGEEVHGHCQNGQFIAVYYFQISCSSRQFKLLLMMPVPFG